MKKVLSKPVKQVYGVASLYVNEIRNTGSGTCSNSGTAIVARVHVIIQALVHATKIKRK